MNAIWLIIVATGVFMDISTSGFLFTVFSASALCSLGLSALNASAFVQICAFFVLSIALMITIVPYIRKKIKDSKTEFIPQENRLINRELVLPEDLDNTLLINIDGVFWTIKTISGPITKGEKVKITSIEGNKYIVEKTKGE